MLSGLCLLGRSGRVENIHDIMFGGALKTKVLENASTEKASTKQRISQGWKTHVRKCKYESAGMENASTENASTMQTFSQIKKSLVLHKLVWCIFKWGGKVDYRLFFSDNVNNQK